MFLKLYIFFFFWLPGGRGGRGKGGGGVKEDGKIIYFLRVQAC
jgi:hypothetical protein